MRVGRRWCLYHELTCHRLTALEQATDRSSVFEGDCEEDECSGE